MIGFSERTLHEGTAHTGQRPRVYLMAVLLTGVDGNEE